MYVPSTRMIISSYDVVFHENVSNLLKYTSQPYAEAMAMRLGVSYIPCATYLRKKIGNIITFAQFEYGDLLSETHDDAERGDKSDDDSIMPPLIIAEKMDVMDSGDKSNDEPISTDTLEDVLDGSKSHLSVNSREA